MLTQEILKQLVYYKEGKLFSLFNDKEFGFKAKKAKGVYYKVGHIVNKQYLIHRLIYLYHYGNLPKIIDHIDGNPLNNNIENLREATSHQNLCNQKIAKNNTSGIKGISWSKCAKKWRALLGYKNKYIHIGYYNTKEEAASALSEARNKYHLEFAKS